MKRRERITDDLLVLRCQEGDAQALAELIDRWQQRLWRHAWRLTGDETAAWDVLQEAWIGISRQLAALEDATAFPAWAYRIVGNKSRDWIRRQQRRRRADVTYGGSRRETGEPTVGGHSQAADLQEALARLPGQDRAILALRYQDGFDVAEIAEILHIPAGTVKSRLHYARERLREHLKGSPNDGL